MKSEKDKLAYKQKRIEQINNKHKNKRKQKKRKNKRYSRRFIQFLRRFEHWYRFFDTLVSKTNSINYNNIHKIINPETFKLPLWRNVSLTQRLALFLNCFASNPSYCNIVPFTLNVSHFFRDIYSNLTYKEAKDELRQRIYDNFKSNLGYVPRYAFVIEDKNKQFHLHGIIEVNIGDIETYEKLRHAFKLSAFGVGYENEEMHKHMLVIKKSYTKKGAGGWFIYMNKDNTAADSLFISNSLKQDIKAEYNALYQEVRDYSKDHKEIKRSNKSIKQGKVDQCINHTSIDS